MSITWPTTVRPGRPEPVVVDERVANALQEVAASPLHPPTASRRILRDSGLFNLIGRPDRRIAAAWEAMALTACLQLVTIITPAAFVEHRAWIGSRAAARLRNDGPDRYELDACPVPALPGWVARLVDLGPRPLLPEPEEPLVSTAVERLLDEAAARRAQGAADLADDVAGVWPDVAHALRAGSWRVWSVEWEWPDLSGDEVGDPAHEGPLLVLDTPAGPARMAVYDGRAGWFELRRFPNTDAWRCLTGMGPDDEELLLAAGAAAMGFV